MRTDGCRKYRRRCGAATGTYTRRGRGGFTMVEIIVVVIIIAVLATLIGPRFFGEVGKAKNSVAQQKIKVIEQAVEKFYYEYNRFPAGLGELVERPGDVEEANWNPMLKSKDLVDPWNRPFIYQYPGQHDKFDLSSLGADGRDGGSGEDADVHNW
jgi:general secretion pathway protein G